MEMDFDFSNFIQLQSLTRMGAGQGAKNLAQGSTTAGMDNFQDTIAGIMNETIQALMDAFTQAMAQAQGQGQGQAGQSKAMVNGGRGDDNITLAGNGSATVHGGRGDDTITSGDGNQLLFGDRGDDVIRGGAGDDQISGGRGSDEYIYAAGDGNDTISGDDLQGQDTLTFEDLNQEDVSFVRDGDNLVVETSDGESITIENFYNGQADRAVDEFKFADGSTLDADDVEATNDSQNNNSGQTININGGPGDDNITVNLGDLGGTENSNATDTAAGTETTGAAGTEDTAANDGAKTTINANGGRGDDNITVGNQQGYDQELYDRVTEFLEKLESGEEKWALDHGNYEKMSQDVDGDGTEESVYYPKSGELEGARLVHKGDGKYDVQIPSQGSEQTGDLEINANGGRGDDNIEINAAGSSQYNTTVNANGGRGDDNITVNLGGGSQNTTSDGWTTVGEYDNGDGRDKVASPIAVDLGQGIGSTGDSLAKNKGEGDIGETINFDGKTTEWFSGKEGILTDANWNEDGKMGWDDLMGDAGVTEDVDGDGVLSGFDKLAGYDTNGDGKIAGNELEQVNVWQDANQNGKVDDGEMKSAEEAGIESINTNMNQPYTGAVGEEMKGSSVIDGEERDAVDVWFRTE